MTAKNLCPDHLRDLPLDARAAALHCIVVETYGGAVTAVLEAAALMSMAETITMSLGKLDESPNMTKHMSQAAVASADGQAYISAICETMVDAFKRWDAMVVDKGEA